MITEKIKCVLKDNASTISTLDEDGNIHSIAVACIKVVKEDKLVITDNFMSQTVDNLKKNTQMTLLVVDGDWRSSECKAYELNGKAEYFTQGEWREFVKKDPDNKGLAAKGAILFTVEKIKESA